MRRSFNRFRFFVSFAWHAACGGRARSRALNRAYSERDWAKFDALLEEPGLPASIGDVWRAMRDAYFGTLVDPASAWCNLGKRLAQRGHFMGYLAFQQYLGELVSAGDLERFKQEYPRQHREFAVPMPLNSVSAAAALFIHRGDFAGCGAYLAAFRASLPPAQWPVFDLKAFAYKWMVDKELSGVAAALSEGLMAKMEAQAQAKSPATSVLAAHTACWSAIRSTPARFLTELRYDPAQRAALRERVLQALRDRAPLLLLRLGDGEAYAFSNAAAPHLRDHLDRLWWGEPLPDALRSRLVARVQECIGAADIIGLPSAPRLAQVLHEFKPGPMSDASRKLEVLFQGVAENVRAGVTHCSWWVDEYANYAFASESALRPLLDAAERVVLVGCFDLPSDHFLQAPHVHVVPIPPARKVSQSTGVVQSSEILPAILERLEVQVAPLLGPGCLLLLAAGFAGKPLLEVARQRGAVALDFGSALDHVLGYPTRSPELRYLFDLEPQQPAAGQ